MLTQENATDLRAILKDYSDKGFKLFPLMPKEKKPFFKGYRDLATTDLNQLIKWSVQYPGCNWGLMCDRSGLVAVDIDKTGIDKWKELVQKYGEPKTLKQKSGSGIGFHYVFKADKDLKFKKNLDVGIDIKFAGYIAVYPSIHPKTNNKYVWMNAMGPSNLDSWLAELIIKPKVEKTHQNVNASDSYYHDLVSKLKEKELSYEEWTKAGMALHHEFQGSDEGLDLYLYLTENLSYQDGDLEKAEAKWQGFQLGDSGITGAALINMAINHEIKVTDPERENVKDMFDTVEETENIVWMQTKEGTWVTESYFELMSEINAMGFAVMNGILAGTIVKVDTDVHKIQSVKQISLTGFKTETSSMGLITPKGKIKPAWDIWVKSGDRKEYRDIVFRKDADPQDLNLWSEIPCKRLKGDASKILWYIEKIICSGNKNVSDYFIQYLAHMVQKPEEKPTVVFAFVGDEGTGKGLLTEGFLRGILKSFYTSFKSMKELKKDFNLNQTRKFLTVFDEANWKKDEEVMDALKHLTGSEKMMVEEKHGGRYAIENYSRYMFTSNSDSVVKIGLKNRRFLVVKVSTDYLGDPVYNELWTGIKRGNLKEIFYDYLMDVDISKFNPYAFPVHLDTGAADLKVESLGPVSMFWDDILIENPRGFISTDSLGNTVLRRDTIIEEFRNFQKQTNDRFLITPKKFWHETKTLLKMFEKNQERHIRINGKLLRIFDVPEPRKILENFCNMLRLPFPENFDELNYISENTDSTS